MNNPITLPEIIAARLKAESEILDIINNLERDTGCRFKEIDTLTAPGYGTTPTKVINIVISLAIPRSVSV